MLTNKKERGQGIVEYALLIILVALVVIIALTLMGTQVSSMFSSITAVWPI